MIVIACKACLYRNRARPASKLKALAREIYEKSERAWKAINNELLDVIVALCISVGDNLACRYTS